MESPESCSFSVTGARRATRSSLHWLRPCTPSRRPPSALSKIKVVGIDSEDTVDNAKSFIKASGVTFPVAYDPNLVITSGTFYFRGDPYAVFVNADGTINRIVRGAQLDPSTFSADEKALIPSGK